MSKNKFISTTFFTLIFFNLARFFGGKIFAKEKWWIRINTDNWHHYQLGLLLIFLAFIFLRKKRFLKDLLLAVASGMVIDESMYLFYPLNSSFSHYHPVGIFFEFVIFGTFALIIIKYGKRF